MFEKIILDNKQILLSESVENPDSIIGKFIICDFQTNKNNVRLNRETITAWLKTLVNKPLVGRVQSTNGIDDFTSHNVKYVTTIDESGKVKEDLVFETDAFGTFVSAEIETIDNVEYIVATCEIWKRFTRACKVIERRVKEGSIATSWEIAVEEATKSIENGRLVKVVNQGRFLSHCLLGDAVKPAYSSSKLLECASEDEDAELFSAILLDVASQNQNPNGNEVEKMEEEKTIDTSGEGVNTGGIEVGEAGTEASVSVEEPEIVGEVEEANPTVESDTHEQSELTTRDLYRKIGTALQKFTENYLQVVFIFPESHTGWARDYEEKETDIQEFTYVVENDEVTIQNITPVVLVVSPRQINSAMEEKNTALIEAQKQINELSATIEQLSPYKEASETAAREKAEAERKQAVETLRSYAEESGMVSNEELASGEIAEMIESLKETDLKVLISDRIVAKQKGAKPAETAQKRTTKMKAEINFQEETSNPVEALRKFIQRG